MGKRFDAHPTRAAQMADVVVIVDREDRWLTTKDRYDAHGQYLHPGRRAQLLTDYHVLVRPTNGEPDDL